MKNLNVQQFAGRLVKDPVLKEVGSGKLVMDFSLAYNTGHISDGAESRTSFIDVSLWEKKAEFLATRLRKGMAVLVTGALVQFRWKNTDGQTRSNFKLVAQDICVTDLKNRPVLNESEGQLATVAGITG